MISDPKRIRQYLMSLSRLECVEGPVDYDQLEWHSIELDGTILRLSVVNIGYSDIMLVKTFVGKAELEISRFMEITTARSIYRACLSLGMKPCTT